MVTVGGPPPVPNPVSIGVDVGQLHDPTALCATEVARVETGQWRPLAQPIRGHVDKTGQWVPPRDADPVLRSLYTVRSIKRLPLGTSYPEVAIHLADLLCSPLLALRTVCVLMDVTGVGRPVYEDLLREIELRKQTVKHIRGVLVKPISFVHGETYRAGTGTLGKAFLVSRLQSLLQSGRIQAPDTAEVRATLEELKVYEIKIDQNGRDTYGGQIGKHDDLATALGLSVLEDPYGNQVRHSARVY